MAPVHNFFFPQSILCRANNGHFVKSQLVHVRSAQAEASIKSVVTEVDKHNRCMVRWDRSILDGGSETGQHVSF